MLGACHADALDFALSLLHVGGREHRDLEWIPRLRNQDAIADVVGQVLGLCVVDGWSTPGLVAIDGTKVAANASAWANRTRKLLAEEILAGAEQLGERRGDELTERWSDRRDRYAANSTHQISSSQVLDSTP